MKKGYSAIGLMITIAVGLIILVVLAVIVFKGGKDVTTGTACNTDGGVCKPECGAHETELPTVCPAEQKCCKIMLDTDLTEG